MAAVLTNPTLYSLGAGTAQALQHLGQGSKYYDDAIKGYTLAKRGIQAARMRVQATVQAWGGKTGRIDKRKATSLTRKQTLTTRPTKVQVSTPTKYNKDSFNGLMSPPSTVEEISKSSSFHQMLFPQFPRRHNHKTPFPSPPPETQ
jgi:hypothetical protein